MTHTMEFFFEKRRHAPSRKHGSARTECVQLGGSRTCSPRIGRRHMLRSGLGSHIDCRCIYLCLRRYLCIKRFLVKKHVCPPPQGVNKKRKEKKSNARRESVPVYKGDVTAYIDVDVKQIIYQSSSSNREVHMRFIKYCN